MMKLVLDPLFVVRLGRSGMSVSGLMVAAKWKWKPAPTERQPADSDWLPHLCKSCSVGEVSWPKERKMKLRKILKDSDSGWTRKINCQPIVPHQEDNPHFCCCSDCYACFWASSNEMLSCDCGMCSWCAWAWPSFSPYVYWCDDATFVGRSSQSKRKKKKTLPKRYLPAKSFPPITSRNPKLNVNIQLFSHSYFRCSEQN